MARISGKLLAESGRQLRTIYIGGGTPTSLSSAQMAYLMDAIRDHAAVRIYGPMDVMKKTPVTSINIKGMVCSTVGEQLNEACSIMVRTGLHCAPGAHRTLGTFPTGTVRFSFGNFSTEAEVDTAVEAILTLADYAAAHKEV